MNRKTDKNEKYGYRRRAISLMMLMFVFIGIWMSMGIVSVNADVEPNNNYDDAELITPGTYTGTLNASDEDDFYMINISAGQKLYANLTLMEATASGYWEFTLWDDEKLEVDSDYDGVNENVILRLFWTTNSAESSYIYYIGVMDHDSFTTGASGEYSLEVSLVSQNDVGSGGDAADTINNAIPITAGTYSDNWLDNEDNNDYYRFTVGAGQIISADLTLFGTTAYGYFEFTLWNEDLMEVDSRSDSADDNAIIKLSWTTNSAKSSYTYYLGVMDSAIYSTAAGGWYDLEVSLVSQNDGDSGGDAGDTTDTAPSITSGTFSQGWIDDEDNYDYFNITVPAGNTIFANLSLFEETAYGYWELVLYDEDKTKIDYVRDNTDTNLVLRLYWTTNSAQSSSTYFIGVLDSPTYTTAAGGEYELEIALTSQDDAGSGGDAADSDPSVVPENPTQITPGSHTGYMNTAQGDDNRDIYVISVEEDTKITVTTDPASSMVLDVWLRDNETNDYDVDSGNDIGESAEVSWVATSSQPVIVWLKCQSGEGIYGVEVTIELPTVEPSTAVVLDIPDPYLIGPQYAYLSWSSNADADFDRYEVYYSKSSGSIGTLYEIIDAQSTRSSYLYTLEPETTYYFTVRVVNTEGDWADSNQVTAKTTLEYVEDPEDPEDPYDPEPTSSDDSGIFVFVVMLLVYLIPILLIVTVVVVVISILRRDKTQVVAPPQQPTYYPPQQPPQQPPQY
jgi:hypothetical protein